MRRLLPWLVNGLCVVSLLACLGAAWLWRRTSYEELYASAFGLTAVVVAGGCGRNVTVEVRRGWPEPRALAVRRYTPQDRADTFIEFLDKAGANRECRLWGVVFFRHSSLLEIAADGSGPLRCGDWIRDRGGVAGPPWARVARAGVTAPPAAVVAVTAVPPLLWLIRRSRRTRIVCRRRRLGLCLNCGYDLTGNASGRCPECGEPLKKKTATQ